MFMVLQSITKVTVVLLREFETSELSTIPDKAVITDLLIHGFKQHLRKKVF